MMGIFEMIEWFFKSINNNWYNFIIIKLCKHTYPTWKKEFFYISDMMKIANHKYWETDQGIFGSRE